jgi:hypothetical protein
MPKIEIMTEEFKGAKKNDILVYNGERWLPSPPRVVHAELLKRIGELETERVQHMKTLEAYEKRIETLEMRMRKFLVVMGGGAENEK